MPKNNFRQFFALAAEETRAKSRNDGRIVLFTSKYFICLGLDTSIIEIDKEDIQTFIENLMFLMTS